MGFRNPLTTAYGVDTGGAGQRVVVTETGGRHGGGSIELYPNLPVDAAPGVLEAGSDEAGAVTVLGSPPNAGGRRATLTLRGVDVGDEGAYLDLPPGAKFYIGTEPLQRRRAWLLPRVSGALADSFPGDNTFKALIGATITGAPAGDYLVTLTLVLAGSASIGGNVQLNVGGVNVLDNPRSDVVTVAQPNTYTHLIEDFPGGDLVLGASQLLVSGTGTIFTRGSGIRIVYLGPRK